jgi:lactoylglutathione lyase
MKPRLGWVIVYVPDVEAAFAFYERSFGLERRFLAPDSDFGELETGETRLSFASEQLAASNFEGGFQRPSPERPFNIELALVFEDVPAAFASALENGASALTEPHTTSWGQTIAYVRDPFGTLLELATPTD